MKPTIGKFMLISKNWKYFLKKLNIFKNLQYFKKLKSIKATALNILKDLLPQCHDIKSTAFKNL